MTDRLGEGGTKGFDKMNHSYIFGIDLGTTNTKLIAMAENGQIFFHTSIPTVVQPVSTGGEIDPIPYFLKLKELIRTSYKIVRKSEGDGLCGISFAGMAEAGCLIDAANKPQSPIFLWYDRRGEVEADSFAEKERTTLMAVNGLRPSNVPTIYKLCYLKKHLSLDGLRWCGVPEWAALCLSGYWFTDQTLAQRTGMFDLSSQLRSPIVSSITGVDQRMFPEAVSVLDQRFTVSSDMAADLRIPPSTRIFIAGHDDIAASFGAGLAKGNIVNSAGTAEALSQIANGCPAALEIGRAGIASAPWYVPGTWVILGGVGTTGNLLSQVHSHFGLPFETLDLLAARHEPCQKGKVTMEVTSKKLTTVHFSGDISAAQAANAVYEFIINSFLERLKSFGTFADLPKNLIITGGSGKLMELNRRKAAACGGLSFEAKGDFEAAAVGAARLAWLAIKAAEIAD